jgi:hypothetical protein
MIQRTLISALVCLAMVAQTAAAHPMKLKPHPVPSSSPESLQQILDGLVVSGPAIDAGAPQNIQLWDNASGPMTANVVVDFTGRSQTAWFGMYPADNPKDRAFLLVDSMKPSDVASVAFLDDGSILIRGGIKPKSKAQGFDGPFGFFVKISSKGDSPVFLFTESDLNGGTVRAKVFQGNGTTTLKFPGLQPGLFLENQFLIAFETGKDGGFNDFIVSVSGIVAAPEPALSCLLGLSLAALWARRPRST